MPALRTDACSPKLHESTLQLHQSLLKNFIEQIQKLSQHKVTHSHPKQPTLHPQLAPRPSISLRHHTPNPIRLPSRTWDTASPLAAHTSNFTKLALRTSGSTPASSTLLQQPLTQSSPSSVPTPQQGQTCSSARDGATMSGACLFSPSYSSSSKNLHPSSCSFFPSQFPWPAASQNKSNPSCARPNPPVAKRAPCPLCRVISPHTIRLLNPCPWTPSLLFSPSAHPGPFPSVSCSPPRSSAD